MTSEKNNNILEVSGLTNSFGEKTILRDVSFTLEEGEILCLLGPSGSGKTTLLRLLAGLEEESNGSVLFCGKDLKEKPPHKRNIGMMFQEYALFPHLSVAENISFGLEMQKWPAQKISNRVAEMLEIVGLTNFEERSIAELSGGEKQRVALARSLAPAPKLLLLDEPLGSLDRTLRDRLTREIRNILKEVGVTSVFVTHDQAEAFGVADKIAILHEGILKQFGHPEEIYLFPDNPVVAFFLGFKNIFSGSLLENGTFQTAIATFPIEVESFRAVKSDDCFLLLRPDGAAISTNEEEGETLLFQGQMRERTFQGSNFRVEVEIKNHILVFDLPLHPSPPGVGERVKLSINPSSLILLGQ